MMKEIVKIASEIARFAKDLKEALDGKDCSGVAIAISNLRRRAYSLLDELNEIEKTIKQREVKNG